MKWIVIFHTDFVPEFYELSATVQDELYAQTRVLERFGPTLGRPHVDTLEGSKYPNMKELRFNADNGVWRVAFGFDLERKAVLLVGGNKSGVSSKRFYKGLIKKADARMDSHFAMLEENKSKKKGRS